MKKVFVDENPGLVQTARMLLDQHGIACFVKNEFASGGVGELSFLDAWPELWVLRDEDADAADRLLAVFEQEDEDADDTEWRCPQCGETNDASFEICWKCGWEDPAHS